MFLRLNDRPMMPAGDTLQGGAAGLAEDMALLGGESDDNTPISEVPEGDEPETDDESVIPEEDDKTPKEEIEEEEEEPKPDESKPIYNKPTIAQLKEAFPDILKKFPALKDVYYREQAYSEVFPTIEDAKVASENDEAFRTIREGVLSGDLTGFFEGVKEADPKSLDKIAGSILPTLNKLSPELHWKATLPVFEGLIKAVYNEGVRYGDNDMGNNLRYSAEHIANFLFGQNGMEVAQGKRSLIPPAPEKIEESPEAKQLKEMQGQRTAEFVTGTQTSMLDGLKNLVLERGQHNKLKIDPDGIMTDFMKTTITEKIMQEVGKSLEADQAHMKHMRSLWTKAKEAGYIGDWKSRIQTAYLERVKSLVPGIRSRLVAEALGTTSALNNNKGDKLKKAASRIEPGNSGKVPSSRPQIINPRQVDWKKTSDMDIINGTATLKN
jgi:hypothetical protein